MFLVSLVLIQVVEGEEEVATRTTAVIGILGEAGAALPVASETITEVLAAAAGLNVPLVAVRPRMEVAVLVTAVSQVLLMATVVLAAVSVMDRVTLVLKATRLVLLETRVSKGRLSTVACPGPPPT